MSTPTTGTTISAIFERKHLPHPDDSLSTFAGNTLKTLMTRLSTIEGDHTLEVFCAQPGRRDFADFGAVFSFGHFNASGVLSLTGLECLLLEWLTSERFEDRTYAIYIVAKPVIYTRPRTKELAKP